MNNLKSADRFSGGRGLDDRSLAWLIGAARVLGTGREVATFDTVPFALWSAAVSSDDFEAVFWRTVAGLGDRDTTCAIACGVTAARVGRMGIPAAWLAAREPLPQWLPTH